MTVVFSDGDWQLSCYDGIVTQELLHRFITALNGLPRSEQCERLYELNGELTLANLRLQAVGWAGQLPFTVLDALMERAQLNTPMGIGIVVIMQP